MLWNTSAFQLTWQGSLCKCLCDPGWAANRAQQQSPPAGKRPTGVHPSSNTHAAPLPKDRWLTSGHTAWTSQAPSTEVRQRAQSPPQRRTCTEGCQSLSPTRAKHAAPKDTILLLLSSPREGDKISQEHVDNLFKVPVTSPRRGRALGGMQQRMATDSREQMCCLHFSRQTPGRAAILWNS